MFINNPLGGSPSDGTDATVIVNVYDGAGEHLGTLGAWPSLNIFESVSTDIVGPEVTAGSFELFIDDREGTGGALSARFSAAGRYSIGLGAVCINPLEEPME